jgi:hypothetical protein
VLLAVLPIAIAMSSATLAGIVWDGSGSPLDAGFQPANTGHGDTFSFDTPVVGTMTQESNSSAAANWRHFGAELDNAAGWFVESRFQLISNNDTNNGEGAAIFLRNAVGSVMLSFRSDGVIGVWDGEAIYSIEPGSYGGVDGSFHDVRMQVDAGGPGFVEILVNGNSQGLVQLKGGTASPAFLSFGDINVAGTASLRWDHVVNNDTVPAPTTIAPATLFTWATGGTGEWDSKSNWSSPTNGAPPDNDNETAIFGDSIGSDSRTVFTDSAITVNSVQFQNSMGGSYAVAGSGSINFAAETGGSMTLPTIAVSNQGSHQFQTIVNLLSDTTADAASNSTLNFNNQINTNGNALNLTGVGVVNLNHSVIGGGAVSGSGTLGTASNTSLGGDLTSTGTLAIEFRGTGEGSGSVPTDVSRFDVSGAANLDGAVDINLFDFTPAAGTTFTILTTTNGINFVGGSTGIGDLNLTGDSTDFSLALGNSGNDLVLSYLASGGVEGDFNGNGTVDAADYTLWRDRLGTNNPLQNDPVGGQVSEAQYLIWKNNFGSSLPGNGGSTAVPEPAALALLIGLVPLAGLIRNR